VDQGKQRGDHEPAPEIEIIPPGAPERSPPPRDGARVFISLGGRATEAKLPSPLALVLAVLFIATMAALVVVAVLGTLLIWLPLVALVVAAMMLSGVIRRYFRRPG
jgi:hypothetical protein